MAHGIMLCDQPFLSDLTKVNLLALMAAKVSVMRDLASFESLLALDQTSDFIIAIASLNNRDIATQVGILAGRYCPNTPLFFLGHVTQLPEKSFNIQNPFDQLALVKTLLKVLKWDKEDLKQQRWTDYIPMPLSLLEHIEKAKDDFYWINDHESGPYNLLCKKDDLIQDKISLWKSQKIKAVYVRAENKFQMLASVNAHLLSAMQRALNGSTEDGLEQVQKAAHLVSQITCDPEEFHKLSEEVKFQMVELSKVASDLVCQISHKLPSNLSKLLELYNNSEKDFVQFHSMLTTYMTIQMIHKEIWYSPQMTQKISLFLFFHDIILIPLYIKYPDLPRDEDLLKDYPKFSAKERQLALYHPKITSNMLESIPNLPIGLDQLILQHHGNSRGDCLETELFEGISTLGKVVIVAEKFATILINNKEEITEEVKKKLFEKLESKLGKKSYIKLLEPLRKIPI